MATRAGTVRWRAVGAGLAGLVMMAGCKDSGLPGRNTPVAEAEQTAWSYPAYEAAGTNAVRIAEQDWMVAGPPIRIPADLLVAVGQDGGHEVFALATDPAPYTRLYLAEGGAWKPFARVPEKASDKAGEVAH